MLWFKTGVRQNTMGEFLWQPSEDYDIAANIKEPPCKHCKYFRPEIEYYDARREAELEAKVAELEAKLKAKES